MPGLFFYNGLMMSTPKVKIRPINGDAEAWTCAEIMASSEPWLSYGRTREINFRTLTAPGAETHVAITDAGEIAGLVIIAMNVPLIRGYVMGLAVQAALRNRGVGTSLLTFAEERIFRESPNVFICVSSFNEGAQRLYARLGFTKIGEITDFAVPGAHEHLLRKTLGPQSTFKRAT
ncbi:MAG: [ribosomal protein S18]-alanine N-acetyltransferase [Humisphaera sp.]|nr:[ribosomal protein S18]-alanine N-acetyltransferase [Humisphaera sp.]